MQVWLLAWTPNAVETIATAARLCYMKGGIAAAMEAVNKGGIEGAKKLIASCLASGHESVLEHASFTFGIEGISRACSHQLVRHRLTAISQQSQRYVELGEDCWEGGNYVVPPSFKEMDKAHPAWAEQGATGQLFKVINNAKEAYGQILLGFEVEDITGETAQQDARYVLPNAHKTNLVWTMNFRELMHVCSVRLCRRAQWEIRGVLEQMVATMVGQGAPDDHQFLAKFLHPKCVALGYCPEGKRSCGKMPTKEVVLSAYERVGMPKEELS